MTDFSYQDYLIDPKVIYILHNGKMLFYSKYGLHTFISDLDKAEKFSSEFQFFRTFQNIKSHPQYYLNKYIFNYKSNDFCIEFCKLSEIDSLKSMIEVIL